MLPLLQQHPTPRSHLLWIDGVGVFQLLMSESVVIGRFENKTPNRSDDSADIALMGNLSRRHLLIGRQQDDYIATPLSKTLWQGRLIEQPTVLAKTNEFHLNDIVRLKLTISSALSASARLDVLSTHRGSMPMNGFVLMADTCLLGVGDNNHVRCSACRSDIVLARRESKLAVRSGETLTVDGLENCGWTEWSHGQVIETAGLRMRLETQ